MLRSAGFQGGIGSSSLKECIELLNATVRNSPAPLDSGVGQKITDPSQIQAKMGVHLRERLETGQTAPFPAWFENHFVRKTDNSYKVLQNTEEKLKNLQKTPWGSRECKIIQKQQTHGIKSGSALKGKT